MGSMTPEQFRAARKSFDLTQKEWGHYLGIGREHVAKIEAGTVKPSKTLAKLVAMYQFVLLPVGTPLYNSDPDVNPPRDDAAWTVDTPPLARK
jgi:DNA-binding XRE family transcriptional regulator